MANFSCIYIAKCFIHQEQRKIELHHCLFAILIRIDEKTPLSFHRFFGNILEQTQEQ
jgi:hypothetical protein